MKRDSQATLVFICLYVVGGRERRACSVVKIEDFSGDEDESKIEILTER